MGEDDPRDDTPGYALDPEPVPPPAPVLSPTREDLAEILPEDVCLQCGYNLRGLTAAGMCPECGTPVERSLQGNLLRYSAAPYLASLHRGVFLILTAIAAQVMVVLITFVTAIALAGTAAGIGNVELGLSYLMSGLWLVLLYGWWLFSAPDPAFVGMNQGTVARQVVRAAVVAAAVLTALAAALDNSVIAGTVELELLSAVISGGLLVAHAVSFFASMLYVRWLAPRLPNDAVHRRAKLLMWVGPLLVTVGAMFCLIGPLIALVLYWNLLNWVRLDIKRIREADAGARRTAERHPRPGAAAD